MARGVKEEIVKAFCNELKNMPLDKITVTEIIRMTGISRNSFYYHFEDIYALLHYVIAREEEKLIRDVLFLKSWDEVLRNLITYARDHKKEIYHIYKVLSRDRIEQHVFSSTEDILLQIVRLEAKGLNVSKEDVEYIANFYRYAIIGFFMHFLWNDMEIDAEDEIDKIAALVGDNIRQTLIQCANRNDRLLLK